MIVVCVRPIDAPTEIRTRTLIRDTITMGCFVAWLQPVSPRSGVTERAAGAELGPSLLALDKALDAALDPSVSLEQEGWHQPKQRPAPS